MGVIAEVEIDEDGSLIIKIKDPKRLLKKKRPAEQINNLANEVITYYCDEYKVVYKSYPLITPKTAGVAKRLISHMPVDRIKKLLTHYLGMKDRFFMLKRHDLVTFEASINTVHVSLQSGVRFTDKTARQAESTDVTKGAIRSWLEEPADS